MNGFIKINNDLINTTHIIRIYEQTQFGEPYVMIDVTSSLKNGGYLIVESPKVSTKEELLAYINKSLHAQQFNKKFDKFVNEDK